MPELPTFLSDHPHFTEPKSIADAKVALGIAELEQKYTSLEARVARHPTIVPIQSLAPSRLVLNDPILAVVEEEAGAFTANWVEANIATCGDTLHEAINALKELITEVVELHSSESDDSLGAPMKQQKEVLARFVCLPSPASTPNKS